MLIQSITMVIIMYTVQSSHLQKILIIGFSTQTICRSDSQQVKRILSCVQFLVRKKKTRTLYMFDALKLVSQKSS